jgi:hypothetical protein
MHTHDCGVCVLWRAGTGVDAYALAFVDAGGADRIMGLVANPATATPRLTRGALLYFLVAASRAGELVGSELVGLGLLLTHLPTWRPQRAQEATRCARVSHVPAMVAVLRCWEHC